MKKVIMVVALCLVPLTASATDQKVWKDPQLAADQSLPHGLDLLSGHSVITPPEQSKDHDPEKAFVVKVPSTSGHESWWSDQYAQQLENLGWNLLSLPPPLKMLHRQTGQCSEQMILISMGPNSQKSEMLKGANIPELEFNAVAFNYSNSGTCEP